MLFIRFLCRECREKCRADVANVVKNIQLKMVGINKNNCYQVLYTDDNYEKTVRNKK
jgi:hypothetical protein